MVLALGLVLTGCEETADSPGTAAFPTASSGAGGTELPDGLRVPKGAHLILPVLGKIGETEPTTRVWTAYMAVTGPPVQAFNELIRTADAAGFDLHVEDGFRTCSAVPDGRGAEVPIPEVSGKVDLLLCGAHAGAYDVNDPHNYTSLGLRLQYGDIAGVPQRFLVASYARIGTGSDVDLGLPPQTYDGPVPEVDAPTQWTFPGTGDAFGGSFDTGLDHPLTVAEGSEPLAPPLGSTSVNAGYEALFAVTGDPQTVVERYLQEFKAEGFTDRFAPGVVHEMHGGREYWSASTIGAGAGAINANAEQHEDGRTWLTIVRYND